MISGGTFERGPSVLGELFDLIKDRQQEMPKGSYTNKLFQEGVGRIAEMAVEVADLLYHALVLLAATGVQPEAVYEELRERRK